MQQLQCAAETLCLFAKLDCSLHTGILTAVDTDGDCAKLALNPVQLRSGCGLVYVSSAEPASFFSRCRFRFPRKPRPNSWFCTRLSAGPLCPLHPLLQTGIRPNRRIDGAVCNRKSTVCRKFSHFYSGNTNQHGGGIFWPHTAVSWNIVLHNWNMSLHSIHGN